MIQTRLKGMGVALITPFKEDDSVDYDALLRLVDYQLQNGTDFLCVLGTTAETPTLTKEEKDKIKRLIIERVNGRIPTLLGVSSNCTRAVVETLKNDDMTGVDDGNSTYSRCAHLGLCRSRRDGRADGGAFAQKRLARIGLQPHSGEGAGVAGALSGGGNVRFAGAIGTAG